MAYKMFVSPFWAPFGRSVSAAGAALSILLVLTCGARAQTDQEHQAYVQAVNILTKQGESAPLERLVQRVASDYLKRQGLEWLVANCLRRGETARAKAFADQLLSRDTDNALALAMTSDAITQTAMGGQDSENTIGMVKRALRGLPQLKAPELMEEAEFLGFEKPAGRKAEWRRRLRVLSAERLCKCAQLPSQSCRARALRTLNMHMRWRSAIYLGRMETRLKVSLARPHC
jgi:hypothetical protein